MGELNFRRMSRVKTKVNVAFKKKVVLKTQKKNDLLFQNSLITKVSEENKRLIIRYL
jgi:hypothetical protein